jgi:siroheme synthase
MSVKTVLDRFADWRDKSNPAITEATVSVREATARRVLRLKKGDPLIYRGLSIRCVGSPRWRRENPGVKA